MITNKIRTAICGLFAALLSTAALAASTAPLDNDNHDNLYRARERQKPPWEVSGDITWLPDSSIRNTDGNLAMTELKAGVTRRFRPHRQIELSAGVHYSQRNIDAPEAAQLPGSLQLFSVNLGGEYFSSETLSLGLKVSPGISSDFRSFASSDVRVPVSLQGSYQISEGLALLGGIAYTGQIHSLTVLPVIGLRYAPGEEWLIALGFPRTGVSYHPDRDTDFFVTGEFSGGEYRLHNPSIGASVISYKDYRVLTGADIRLLRNIKLGFAGGYAFAREFVFYEGNRSSVFIDGTPFGRLTVRFQW